MPQKMFHVAELWRTGYRALYYEIGEKPLIIIVTSGVSSIYDKSVFLREHMGCKILWLSKQVIGMRHVKDQDILACCLQTLCKLFTMRKRTDNIVALMVHAAVSHSGVEKLKQLIPGMRVVSYVYDFMDIFVPPSKRKIWKEFHGSEQQSKVEYKYLKEICRGRLSDAVIYKDGGRGWSHLKDCPVPTLWFPQAITEKLYQPLPDPSIPDSFCYIGTIVPKETHSRPSGLFDDIMMEDIFRDVSNQKYRIHAYVLNPHPSVIQEYQEKFPTPLVQLFRGDILDNLLPRCRGRYKWGWMMYYYPRKIVMPMVGITLPTKLFTYLALGIPPVVSEEMTASRKVVEKYGCGVVVSHSDIQNLDRVLGQYDYKKLQKGVLRARKELRLERFMPQLVTLLKRVMKKEPIMRKAWNEQESYQVQQEATPTAYLRPTAIDRTGGASLRGGGGKGPTAKRRPPQGRGRGKRRHSRKSGRAGKR